MLETVRVVIIEKKNHSEIEWHLSSLWPNVIYFLLLSVRNERASLAKVLVKSSPQLVLKKRI